jgi:hypothetical protein
MIRSESISSSWIEGIRENARAIAVAQIGDEAGIAQRLLRHPQRGCHEGCNRTEQVWIGGSNRFNADYAGPPHESVHSYLTDLLDHANTSGDLPGFRSDSSIHRAVDLLVEYPVISARFLADSLDVSTVSAQKLVKQLDAVGIARVATGKYRKSAVYQADDILDLLEHGTDVTR